MKKFKLGLLGMVCLGLTVVSCSKDEEQTIPETYETADITKKIPQKVIEAAEFLELNTNFIKYGDFVFPDGTSEERLFFEDDITMTEQQLFQLKELAEAAPEGRQYRTFNLVSQGRNISIIGYTGSGFSLSNKERTALQWAVNNYNRLSGVSIRFTLTFGTNFQNKDMVVYNNTANNPGSAGGSAGFPSNGLPNKFVQIYGLSPYSTNVNEHVITHEIGHSIGFRHTDWFDRLSCGGGVVYEGVGGVGAAHIPGTPTGRDFTSIMQSCFNLSVSGEFNANDITALEYMYPIGGSTSPCDGVPAWQSGVTYSVGDQVTYFGNLFEFTASGWVFISIC